MIFTQAFQGRSLARPREHDGTKAPLRRQLSQYLVKQRQVPTKQKIKKTVETSPLCRDSADQPENGANQLCRDSAAHAEEPEDC